MKAASKDTTKAGGGRAQSSGAAAEALAASWLERQGVRLLARNYRCRGGEIDLIGRYGGLLLFIEVRLRRHAGFGGAAASITAGKRQRLVLAASHYLAAVGEMPCRFDCVLLDALDAGRIEWLQGAFDASV